MSECWATPRAVPLLRWGRALLLAGVAMCSGSVAHLSSEGMLPGPTALVVLFVTCAAGVACFLGTPASTLRVVALTIGGQTFVHGSLTAMSGHRGDVPLRRTPAPVQHLIADLTGSHAAMALAHLAAALLVGLWLAVGERSLWALLVLLADVAGLGVRAATSAYAAAGRVGATLGALVAALSCSPARVVVAPPRPTRHLAKLAVRRGPPLVLAA